MKRTLAFWRRVPAPPPIPSFDAQFQLERQRHARVYGLKLAVEHLAYWQQQREQARTRPYGQYPEIQAALDENIVLCEHDVREHEQWLAEHGYPVPIEQWRPVEGTLR